MKLKRWCASYADLPENLFFLAIIEVRYDEDIISAESRWTQWVCIIII